MVVVVVSVLGSVSGCGRPTVARRALPGGDAAPAGSGGATSPEPELEVPDAMATGGRGGTGGRADAGRTGGAGGKVDAAVSQTGGAGGETEPDAAAPAGGSSGSGGGPQDAAGDLGGGTGGMSGTGGQGPPDAARPPPSSGMAACHPDPKVILICKQLEPACLNCPDRTIWDACFRLSATGDDEACARYAVDNDCTVDQGGNWCGSLDCGAQGCPGATCRQAQGNGVSGTCQMLLDECPCQ